MVIFFGGRGFAISAVIIFYVESEITLYLFDVKNYEHNRLPQRKAILCKYRGCRINKQYWANNTDES